MSGRREGWTVETLTEENRLLFDEVQVSRRASEITAELVVKQFVDLDRLLRDQEAQSSVRTSSSPPCTRPGSA